MNNNEFNCDPKFHRSSDDFIPSPESREGSLQARLQSLTMAIADMEQQSRIDEAIQALEEAVKLVFEVDAVRQVRSSESSMNSISAGSAWTFVEKLGFYYERQERYEEARGLYETFLPGLIEAEAGNLHFIAKAIFPLVRTLAQLSELNKEPRLLVDNDFALLFAGICFNSMTPKTSPNLMTDPWIDTDIRAQELASYLTDKLQTGDILPQADRKGFVSNEHNALLELWLRLFKWANDAFKQEQYGTACELIETAYKMIPRLVLDAADHFECLYFYAHLCTETGDFEIAKQLMEEVYKMLPDLALGIADRIDCLNFYAEICMEMGDAETAENLFAESDEIMQRMIDQMQDPSPDFADMFHMEAPEYDFNKAPFDNEFMFDDEPLFANEPTLEDEMPPGFALDEPQDSDDN